MEVQLSAQSVHTDASVVKSPGKVGGRLQEAKKEVVGRRKGLAGGLERCPVEPPGRQADPPNALSPRSAQGLNHLKAPPGLGAEGTTSAGDRWWGGSEIEQWSAERGRAR